ncbi:chloride channel protein [Thermospira aquatica]|uniref:Chloride channel protein n=1 Tax=Thermospira aquatica TaxID=2828656 RepID=A0AAX3BDZ1_9SPIR|nr:chloride channel protein [Thermospira aquatica]URA10315.1 chloride channel protein [Thermospira aquatica]
MKRRVYEGLLLLFTTVKWLILATLVGIIVGFATTMFLKLLNISIEFTHKFSWYFLFLPLVFFLTIIVIKYLAPEAEGHGTEKVIEAIHKNNGKIHPLVVPVKLVATIITLAFGGSAGKEGPSAQIGAGLASIFSDLLRLNKNDRKKLVICGISAGFAAVFGTPMAGAIFGIEVLIVGSMLYEVLLPSFISGMIAFHIASKLGINYFYHHININMAFNEMLFINIVMAGIFFGLVSFFFIEVLKLFEWSSHKLKIWPPFKGLIGGLALILLTFAFSKQYLGLGLDTIEAVLQGNTIVWYAFIIKIIFTSITLSFGGSGGIITPIFFIGTTAGSVFAELFHLDSSIFAAIGMVSLLAGATNTPIAASIMFIELFGNNVAPYAAISCIISFIMTGHRSVYPSQMIGMRKSILFHEELGTEIKKLKIKYKPENDVLFNKIVKYIDAMKNKHVKK